MGNLFSLSYLTSMRPGSLHFSGFVFFLVLILASIVIMVLFNIVRKRKNNIYFRIWRSLNSLAITNLILSIFLLFFAYEEVYILSSRLWILLWFAGMLVWLVFIIRQFREIPKIKEEFAKKKEYQKYIP